MTAMILIRSFIFMALFLKISLGCMSTNCASKCSSCTQPTVTTGSGVIGAGTGLGDLTNVPITFTPGTDANGCSTLQMTCSAATGFTEVIQSLNFNNIFYGFVYHTTANPPPSFTQSLTCDPSGNYFYTSTDGSTHFPVNKVECVQV